MCYYRRIGTRENIIDCTEEKYTSRLVSHDGERSFVYVVYYDTWDYGPLETVAVTLSEEAADKVVRRLEKDDHGRGVYEVKAFDVSEG